MAVRDTLQIGDARLKAPNIKITDFHDQKIIQVVQDLIDTMHENQLIGMAAPQIGENVTAFVTEPRQTKTRLPSQSDILRVYLNPKIVKYSKKVNCIYEGCGSVLHGQLFGPVIRPRQIRIDYFDLNGTKHWLECDGLLARVIQHEYDHLLGIEFTEKVSDYRQLMSVEHYLVAMKTNKENIIASEMTIKQEG